MGYKSEKEQQFIAIIENNRQVIYKVCYMYAADDDHFKDLYQEVLINLWRGIDRFRGDRKYNKRVRDVLENDYSDRL